MRSSALPIAALVFSLLGASALVSCSPRPSDEVREPTPPQGPTGGPAKRGGPGPRYTGLSVSSASLEAIRKACAQAPAAPQGSAYDGPVVDTHVHTSLDNDQGAFALAMLEEMNRNGVSRVLVQGDHSPDLTAHKGLLQVYRQVEESWGKIASVCTRIIPLIYAFDPADPESWSYVEERLATGHYGGVGEIEFLHTRMGIRKPVHSETMDKIYAALSRTKGIFHFQAGIAEAPELGAEIAALIEAHPDITFVWFGSERCFDRAEPQNLTCTVFPNRNLRIFEGLEEWQLRRVVLGTDHSPAGFHSSSAGHLPYESLGEGIVLARQLLGEMPPEAAKGVAHGHFDRLVE